MESNEKRRGITIIRAVKNPASKGFDQLSPDKPYAAQPDKPEIEDGINEIEPINQRENTIHYSDDSFESDDDIGNIDDVISDLDDDMEKSSDFLEVQTEDSDEFTIVELGFDIKVRVPKDLEDAFVNVKALKWTSDEKNKNMIKEKNSTFVTDIYKLQAKEDSRSCSQTLQNITNVDERKIQRSKQCVLSLNSDLKDKITFLVPVKKKFAPKENSDVTLYKAVIECGGNEWKTVPATLKNGYIAFNCTRLNSFGLASCPKMQHGFVDQNGKLLATGADGRLNIDFEEGCVTSKQIYHYSVQRPDAQFAIQHTNAIALVAAVSDKFNLHFNEAQFRKPVSITAKLINIEEKSSDFEEFDVKAILFDEKNSPVLKNIAEHTDDNHYRTKVDKSSRIVFAALRRDTNYEQNDVKTTLKNELDQFFGNKRLCKILLFYIKRSGNHIHFVSACCLKSDRDTIVNKFLSFGRRLIFESEDILLPPQQRVRIHPFGCIGGPSGSSANFFLFFMYATKDNICKFEVEISMRMGGSICAVVEFSADNHRRGNLTKVEFKLDKL